MNENIFHTDPEIMGGTLVFKGTRVPVRTLFEWLETESLDDFLENFPSVSRKQALKVLKIAEKLVIDIQTIEQRNE
jgi:uncharacterized protein (DUF433 family)